jgi:drug/metabolite transporter (DMT)-like permease
MPLPAILLILISTFMHAGWNLIARQQGSTQLFWQITAVVAVLGIGPALLLEWAGRTPILPIVWPFLLGGGVFLTAYYVGLAGGYRNGDFTVVYPLARALPVLILAVIDTVRGHPPSLIGWLGMGLVALGCLIAPLESWRGLALARYFNRATLWILLTAVGTVGYTIIDKAAAELMPAGPDTAARYNVFETVVSFVGYSLVLRLGGETITREKGLSAWKWPLVAAVCLFGAYWLVLWAYQLSTHVSYVVAMRQFSIVIGVIVGAILFREPAPRLRLTAALVIVAGVTCIALGG